MKRCIFVIFGALVFVLIMLLFIKYGRTGQILQNQQQPQASQISITQVPSRPSVIARIVEPEEWYFMYGTPYAIIEILDVSDERFSISESRGRDVVYAKTDCRVLFSTCEDCIYDETFGIHFNDIQEFYVTENEAQRMAEAEAVLVMVVANYYDDKILYTPRMASNDSSEYIPITENGLDTTKATGPFETLEGLYKKMDWIANSAKKTSYENALPERKLSDGMSVEEVKEFFLAWEEAAVLYKDVLNKMRTGRYDPAEDY